MPKPLRSADPNPKDVQFSHFGVLDDGSRSKGAVVTSVVTNLIVVTLLIIVGSIVKNVVAPKSEKNITFVQPVEPPPEVKPPPPPPPVKLPPPPHMEPPKIKLPEPVQPPPPDIKPIEVPVPKPVVSAPAPPKIHNPAPAPVAVNLANRAAAVPNHDATPTAVRLGDTTNPLKPLTGPAVANVNLGARGVPGMNASNVGNGPHATAVQLGNGCPNCQDMNGHGPGNNRVLGVKLGVDGGTGPMNSKNFANRPVQVQLQTQAVPVATQRPAVQTTVAASAPTLVNKPRPIYSEEAKALHLEGVVSVRIKVEPNGAVEVLGIVPGRGLGHGLDQSALQAAQSTRFKPAVDATGHPVEWVGTVTVLFQMG